MGSGGLVVLDERRCMVDLARYFLAFTQIESCGRCTFCRIGTLRMREILERLCAGQALPEELDQLEELASEVQDNSLCGLGRAAPTPVLTTLRHFRSEYEAHLRGCCPAGRCKELIHYAIDPFRCDGCTLCQEQCIAQAITPQPRAIHLVIDPDPCLRCGGCFEVCRFQAVELR
jgi:NADH-quinone oxidoreductase subunit F